MTSHYLSRTNIHNSVALSLFTKFLNQLKCNKIIWMKHFLITIDILLTINNSSWVPCPACGSRVASWAWRACGRRVPATNSGSGSPGTLRVWPERPGGFVTAGNFWERQGSEQLPGKPRGTEATRSNTWRRRGSNQMTRIRTISCLFCCVYANCIMH